MSSKVAGVSFSNPQSWHLNKQSNLSEELPESIQQDIMLLQAQIAEADNLDQKIFCILKTKKKLFEFKFQWKVVSSPTGFEEIQIGVSLIFKGVTHMVCDFVVITSNEERKAVDDITNDDLLEQVDDEAETIKPTPQAGLFF